MEPPEALAILEKERARGRELISHAGSLGALREAEVAVLGRKSRYSEVQRSLGSFVEGDRRAVGRLANEVRAALEEAIGGRRAELEQESRGALLDADGMDVTLPGRGLRRGSLHPLTLVEDRIIEIFTRMGYRVAEGPEIEDDWHNFEALNIPPDHPARTMKDSLYLDVPGLLLRTETSAVQIRTMESQEPPVYVVAPGRVFRRETPDATHSPMFHQVEGLAVDERISFADLKGTLEAFARSMFGPDQQVRLNPTYFPFVEPGAEVEVSCFHCGGTGCPVCGNGWLELLGAGMVHPRVLENCGYDAERYTGFAFGLGIERVAMVRYGVSDLRAFFDGDVRFLRQFEGVA
ncbi:MAG TPA: phenylalanine--tRNA ligase subunit alpha [Actinomycetota bacterium]|nr:phenylalanine--tRNA ligase subunit alpha [Actinomycetota bacterium]